MSAFSDLLSQVNASYEKARSNETDAKIALADCQTANEKLTAMLELMIEASTMKFTLSPGHGFSVTSDEMHKLRQTTKTAIDLLAELAPDAEG